jgi:hypothetical protein
MPRRAIVALRRGSTSAQTLSCSTLFMTIVGLRGAVKRMPGPCFDSVRWRGEKGTGARGAPVPVVGLYVKIKRGQSRILVSHRNDGPVNSP